MTTDPLQNAQKRALQYWFVDGTFEFTFGGLCLVLSAYFFSLHLAAGTWLAALFPVAFFLLMIGGGWLLYRLIIRMKENITFPRTGYVSLAGKSDKNRTKRFFLALVSGVVAVAMVMLVVFFEQLSVEFDATAALTGLVFAGVMTFLGFRIGIQRFFVSAAICFALGITFGFANLSGTFGLVGFYGVLGLIMLLFGGLVLWKYLRHNPLQPEEEA